MENLLQKIKSLPARQASKFLIVCFFQFMLSNAFAQTNLIEGKVTDREDNSGLPGVNILVKGTSFGTTTDVDGNFKLNAPSNAGTLVFSYVGYAAQEVEIGEKAIFNIQLVSSAKELGEVVVTALGIEKEKSKLGYSVQEVKGQDLVKAREPNAINSLVGKVAGLTVGASSEMLGAPNLLLRGKQPLYVIDGVPVNSDTWNISADDVASYTVLKGPTASALYGSRGQYGAIQITTKRGSADKRGFSVDFNSSTMLDNSFIAIPKVQDEYGPGDHGKYSFVDGKGGGLNDGDYDVWGPKFEGQLIPQYDSPVNPNTGVREGTPWVARGKDNLNKFIQNGILSSNNISISSSGEKHDLRFSLSNTYQKGIVPNTRLNTMNFNISAGYDFTKRLRFESNINYNRQFTPNIPDVQYGPNSIIYNITIWSGADWDIDDMKDYWQPGKEGVQSIFAEYQRYHNPYFMSYEWLRGHYKTDVYGYTSLKYDLTDYLKIMGRTQITTYDLLRTEKMPYSAHPYGREAGLGDYREDRRNLFENNTDLLLSFDKDVASDLNVKASLGGNIRTFKYNSVFATTDYLNVPGWYNFNNSLNPRKIYNYEAPMQVYSAYATADLSFRNYVNLALTGRVDKNSTMAKNNDTYFYPSASLSTIISDIVSLPEPISFLKLRGSYARVGSALTSNNISFAYDPFEQFTTDSERDRLVGFHYGGNYRTPYGGPNYGNVSAYNIGLPYNNQPAAYYSNTLTNPNLKPSFSTSWETGFEVRFLQNRIGLEATYFNNLDGPEIFKLPISDASGYNPALVNGIKKKRNGIELTVSGSPIKKASGLSWDVMANWSTFKEVYKEIYPGTDRFNTFFKVGDRVDKFYGTAFYKTPDGQLINDAGGRPITNPVAQFLGNTNPDWVWGINNKFTYKGINMSFQLDGRVGGIIADYIQKQTFRGGRHIETVEGAMGEARLNDTKGVKSYIGEGVVISNGAAIKADADGKILNYNELQFAPNTTETYLQDYISRYYNSDEANIISRSFVKLREVTIGYSVPQKYLGKAINRATISLVGRNLLYFAEKKDIDLDQYIGNLQNGSTIQSPTMRRYGINLNLTF